MTTGLRFRIGQRRSGGFLGLGDAPPAIVGESLTRQHVQARRQWPQGAVGRQVDWSHHGQVRIVELDNGSQIALWLEEAELIRAR